MTSAQSIKIILLVYISVAFYAVLLALIIYNSYMYLYLQKKYKIFPLSLFYAFCIPMTIFRIFENIWIVELTKYFFLGVLWTPAVIKQCVALSQILIMIELAIRIEQSDVSMEYTYDRLVLACRVIVSILCSVIMVIWITVCIINTEHQGGIEDEMHF